MNQNMGRLIRYILIINRLSGTKKFVPADELMDYLNLQMDIRGYDIGISVRTLQRDFKDIEEMFEVKIKNKRGYGYYIVETYDNPTCDYEQLLLNFDLLTSVSNDNEVSGYLLPEHHRPRGSENMPLLIDAIKNSQEVRFEYVLVRQDDKIISKQVKPHFLKESLGLWYLVALEEKNRLKCYGIDRIVNLTLTENIFKRDDTIDASGLFKDSYGIWDDPAIPVEDIELSYSPLDGKFLKAMPLHHSQEILVDNEQEFRIRVRLRVTNDFVIALLSRSNSLTVIKPVSLQERIVDVYKRALERNKTD
ncbi:MAG: transcriptional regulator [Muribaculum sp.]|nr:transcriptional regulator [Muribaculum sp.]